MSANSLFPKFLILLANNKMEHFELPFASPHSKDEEPNKIKH